MTAPKRALAVLFAVNCLNIYDRQALAALVEPLRREFGLSDTQVGALSTGFIVVYALGGLPMGRLADRGSRKRLLAAGLAVWTSLTAAGGMAAGYAALLASRLGVAVGEAACAPAATSWIGDAFPASQRARAMGIFMLGVPLGVALSLAASGAIAGAFGWRAALFAAALPALVLLPLLLRLREPPRAAAKPEGSARGLLRLPVFRWIVVSGALVNFNLYVISTFLPAYLTRFHGMSVARAGIWAGAGSGIAGAIAALGGGAWGDRAGAAHGRLRAAAFAAAAAAPAALAAIALPAGEAPASLTFMMIAYGLLNAYYALVYAAIQDLVEPRLRGTAMAVYLMAMYLCGAAFGPLLTGGLSDLLAGRAAALGPEAARAAGLRQAMLVLPVLAAALALVLAAASRKCRPRLRADR
ncbi:MAG: MFS transporter [Bryobacteraceae bacterium]